MDKRIKQLINNKHVFYKASKSNEEITQFFHEDFFYNYKEYSKNEAKHNYGMSTCGDLSKLCGCCIYGDQLTQVIIDPQNPFYEELSKSLRINESATIKEKYAEIVSDFLIVGKNISLNDPYVLKDTFRLADKTALFTFFNFRDERNFLPIENVYRNLGFIQTADFVSKARKSFELNIKINNNIEAFRRDLENILPHKENAFTFENEEIYYEEHKERLFAKNQSLKNKILSFFKLNDITKNSKNNYTEFENEIINFIEEHNKIITNDDIDIETALKIHLSKTTFNKLIEYYNNGNQISGLFQYCHSDKDFDTELKRLIQEKQLKSEAVKKLNQTFIESETIDELICKNTDKNNILIQPNNEKQNLSR